MVRQIGTQAGHGSRLRLFAAVCVAFAVGVLAATSVENARGATVSFSVDVAHVMNTGTANGARLGIDLDYWWDDDANRASGARPLASAIASMNLKLWRYPGGEKSDGYLWSVPPFSAPNPQLARISSQDWPSNDPTYWSPPGSPGGGWTHPVLDFDEFMAACQAAGCTPDVVVAYDGAYKPAYPGGTSLGFQQALDTAKAWVSYAKLKGYRVKYWEIGNETWTNTFMGSDPGRSVQAQDFVVFARAMKAIDPTIKVCTNAWNQTDFETLLSIAHSDIDCLVVHSYPAWPYSGYNSYRAAAGIAPQEVEAAYKALQNYPNDKSRIEIIDSEYGGSTFGINGSWTQNDLGHALMTAELTGRLEQNPHVAASAYWTTRWVHDTSTTPQDEYDALDAKNNLFAQGKALWIFGTNTLATMVSVAPQTGMVIPFATYDPVTGKLKLIVINKDTVTSRATVTLRNYSGTATSGTVNALTGTSWADLFPVYGPQPSAPVANGQLTLSLSPTSITVVSIP
jgi:alpha-N-arabinofuranosidase